jgi:hypothetical protein
MGDPASPAGSTCSSMLLRGRRFGVKKGMKSEVSVSSLEPSSAVNPMDLCGVNKRTVSTWRTYTFGYPSSDDIIQAYKSATEYEKHV